MVKTLILYDSKYGFTERIAQELSLILGPAKYVRMSDFENNKVEYDVIVLCIPICSEKIDKNVIEYLSQNADWIKEKKVILVCTCFTEKNIEHCMKPVNDILERSIVYRAVVAREALNKEEFVELALNMKKIKDQGQKVMEVQRLKAFMEDFINRHNTCTLATGFGDRTRATPIEYIYMEESIYMLSEGGEKFANILLNSNVSISIFDEYKSMNQLAGMQISGSAQIIDIGSYEYILLLNKKNLKLERITSLPVALNLIKINIDRIEFLWSEFNKMDFDTKQSLYLQ